MNRQKTYTLITISGLVIGLSIFIMFALVSDFTSNFDSFHASADRIYATVQVFLAGQAREKHSAITPAPLAPALKSEFPEITKAARFYPPGRMIVKYRNKIFYESKVRFVDPEFLSIFSFRMKTGERQTALASGNSIVLTEDTALRYFDQEDPVGKTMTLANKIDVVVTGITENLPDDSSIQFDFLVSLPTARLLPGWSDDWSVYSHATFLLLSETADRAGIEDKFPVFIKKYYPDLTESPQRIYLHSLLDFSFNSEGIECFWSAGHISYVTIWIAAFLLLLIACINFMNLSTARYATRAHEVGMRKVVGATRGQLIKQFLGESTLMSLISLPGAIVLYELLSPVFSASLGSIFSLTIMDKPHVLLVILFVTILTGILAGSYPAFYLSSFKPVAVFQRKLLKGKKGTKFRKILVVVQFTFSIILILMTFISIKQSRHNLKVDLGYNRENILAVTIPAEARDKLEVLKKELMQNTDIISVSASRALPIEWNTEDRILPVGALEEDALDMNIYGIYYGFVEMLNIKLIKGRSFSHDFVDKDSVILNETAVRNLQWEDPLGKQIEWAGRKKTVIGVTKDFHFKSMVLATISPAVLFLEPEDLNYILVKYSSPDALTSVIGYTGEKWKTIATGLPYEYITLENALNDVFEGDKTAAMAGGLGILAIFLSCLGLFGLSSYSVERRIKEIGIRKVMGASVSGIVRMLTQDFLKLVALANLIAIPIAYFMMNSMINFLYTYPIKIGMEIFIITAVLSLLIAFLTVTSHTMRSALTNPATSLKYE
ncbi:MAG: ABC transporter permease [Spirochaetes bacterium]|nr:ABC transporter permease [Spirochaetota bacterium]